MTLNGHFALKTVLGLASYGLVCSFFQTKQFGNLQSYAVCIHCQRQKCSTLILVSGDISFMGVFAGVRWTRERRQMRVMLSKTAIQGSSDLPNFHIQGQNYYIAVFSPPLVLLEIDDLEWLFCVKYCCWDEVIEPACSGFEAWNVHLFKTDEDALSATLIITIFGSN